MLDATCLEGLNYLITLQCENIIAIASSPHII